MSKKCAYAQNHMSLPIFLYTKIIEKLCVLKFFTDNLKTYLNIKDKSRTYTVLTNCCRKTSWGENKIKLLMTKMRGSIAQLTPMKCFYEKIYPFKFLGIQLINNEVGQIFF